MLGWLGKKGKELGEVQCDLWKNLSCEEQERYRKLAGYMRTTKPMVELTQKQKEARRRKVVEDLRRAVALVGR